jgi:DNA-binding transcriptional LysR family regulator
VDRLDAMRMLVAAGEAGSRSAASRRLGIPLPTLSRRIAELETRLKADLLVRSTRGLVPTEAGATYLAAVRRILDEVEEAERAAAGEWRAPRGELVVTAPVVFGRLHVLPTVATFLAAYPEIDLRLVLSDRNLGLADDHVDVALRIGALPDSGLKALHLGDVRRIAVASPGFLAAHGGPRAPSDLAALPCVAFEGLSPDRVWTFRDPRGGPGIAVSIRRRLSVDTVEATVDAAAAGIGVARAFTYQCASALAAGTIVRVLRDFEPDPVPVHLLHAGREPLPLKLRTFLDHARSDLGRRLAALARAMAEPGRRDGEVA